MGKDAADIAKRIGAQDCHVAKLRLVVALTETGITHQAVTQFEQAASTSDKRLTALPGDR